MRPKPDLKLTNVRTRFPALRALSAGLLTRESALAWACAVTLGLAAIPGRAQMFIRVAPPSIDEQNHNGVTAMPYANGASPSQPGTGGKPPAGGQREAVLSDDGHVVKMVDANGKEVTKSSYFNWDRWRPTFYADVREYYDDNIFFQSHKRDDFITNISPGIILGWGDYRSELPRLGELAHEFELPTDELAANRFLYIDYHPTIELFAKNSAENAVNESVNVAGSYQYSKLTLQGQAVFQTVSDTDIDVGNRVDRTLYQGNASALYSYSDKTRLEANFLANSIQFSGRYQGSEEFVNRDFLDYQYAPKTNVSVGAALGYLVPDSSSNQLYEQLLARVRFSASDKIYMSGTIGVEVRESNHGTSKVNGIFDLAASYTPFADTILTLAATRSTAPSEEELGEDIVATNVSLTAKQRVWSKLYLNGGVTYTNSDYQRLSSGSGLSRQDNIVSVSIGLRVEVTRYAGIQLATSFLNDDSSLDARTFDDHRLSLQVDFLY